MRDIPPDPRRTPPTPWGSIALHALAAGAFFYVLHHFIMRSSPETTALWTIATTLGAAWLAWSQSRRGR